MGSKLLLHNIILKLKLTVYTGFIPTIQKHIKQTQTENFTTNNEVFYHLFFFEMRFFIKFFFT